MNPDKLFILWTTDNKDIAKNMLLMYALKSNTNNWWKECHLVTWGPSNKLLVSDPEIQKTVKQIQDTGVKLFACQRCAENYGIVNELKDLGIHVMLMGEPLTECLQNPEWRILSV